MSTLQSDIIATRGRTEGARADLLAEAILATNTEVNAISASNLLVSHLVVLEEKTVGEHGSDIGDLQEHQA